MAALYTVSDTHNIWIRILANQEICVHIRRSQRLRLTEKVKSLKTMSEKEHILEIQIESRDR